MFLFILLIFAAICVWQMLAGFAKLRTAKAHPDHPQAAMLARVGKIQAIAGGVMLAGNIVFNLPALRALL
jgi:hypothetical protein